MAGTKVNQSSSANDGPIGSRGAVEFEAGSVISDIARSAADAY
eukprot:COSAG02_NODE_62325_length_266_cov_0.616766_1_plen_42_part_01